MVLRVRGFELSSTAGLLETGIKDADKVVNSSMACAAFSPLIVIVTGMYKSSYIVNDGIKPYCFD
ncbi:hypothetical protein D3C74_424320 [compost metagenome]